MLPILDGEERVRIYGFSTLHLSRSNAPFSDLHGRTFGYEFQYSSSESFKCSCKKNYALSCHGAGFSTLHLSRSNAPISVGFLATADIGFSTLHLSRSNAPVFARCGQQRSGGFSTLHLSRSNAPTKTVKHFARLLTVSVLFI